MVEMVGSCTYIVERDQCNVVEQGWNTGGTRLEHSGTRTRMEQGGTRLEHGGAWCLFHHCSLAWNHSRSTMFHPLPVFNTFHLCSIQVPPSFTMYHHLSPMFHPYSTMFPLSSDHHPPRFNRVHDGIEGCGGRGGSRDIRIQ